MILVVVYAVGLNDPNFVGTGTTTPLILRSCCT